MLSKVSKTIESYNMLKAGERVLVGLSGGADSVSLSLCLKELGYKVACVHVNHCLRGSESDRDESFCVDFCKKHGFELSVFKLNVREYCEENGLSLELGARELRYDAFYKAMQSLGCHKLATAHTLSDSLETTFLNLVRGCGIKGVCGIPPVRDNVVRPLINCSRHEVEEYLRCKNADYVSDSTNFVDDCSRNIIRLNVVPQLLRINGGLEKSFAATTENLRMANNLIENLVCDAVNKATIGENKYDAQLLSSLIQPVSGMTVSRLLSEVSVEPSKDRINDLLRLCKEGGKITLSKELFAASENGILTFEKAPISVEAFEYPFQKELEMVLFDKKLIVKNTADLEQKSIVNKKFTKCVIDCDKIIGVAVIRNRRNGDKIKISGREHTSSIKTLFNADVPRSVRDSIVFIADEEGVIFVEGYGCAQRVMADNTSVDCVEISISPYH